MYADLLEALRWQRPFADAERPRAALRRQAWRRFEQFTHRFEAERGGQARRILARLRSLPEDRQDSVIASPQGFYAASRSCPTDTSHAYFEGAVTVEEILAGESPESASSPCWSALGDQAYAYIRGRGWSLEFSATRLAGFLPVDSQCPATRNEIPGMASISAPVSKAEELGILDRLTGTIGLIKAGSATTLQLFRDFARVIVARELLEERTFQACGARITPGRIVVNNVLGAADDECIADALVHEAIHCAIDHCELEQPIVTELNVEARIQSPWSGRWLDLNTFVQACYVWYGLANFWDQVGRRPDLRSEGGSAMLAQARRGFEISDPVSALDPHKRVLNPAVIDAMQGMRA